MHKLLRKLKSKNGESISEVLVATLVVALGSVLFAGMVNASQVMISNSRDAYNDYLKDHNTIENYEKKVSPSSAAVKITGSINGKDSLNISQKIKLYQDPDKRYFIYEYDPSGESSR